MLFSAIYTADCPQDTDVMRFAPPSVDEDWTLTEENEEYEEFGTEEPYRHRKWAALLPREKFDAFVNKCSIYADSTPTMGSIGASGLGFGCVPAICFQNGGPGESVEAWLQAYVTPVPEFEPKNGMRDHWWDRINNAIQSIYS